jgi:hypothetical protein
MADNLESYFKKHLSDDRPGEDNWNVPSDDVWNKVLPEIQKKRGIFIPWRYFYLLGIFVVAGLLFILWPKNETINATKNENKVITEVSKQNSHFSRKNEETLLVEGNGHDNITPSTISKSITEEIATKETEQYNGDATKDESPATVTNGAGLPPAMIADVEAGKNDFEENSSQNQASAINTSVENDHSSSGFYSDNERENHKIESISIKTIQLISLSAEDVQMKKGTTQTFAFGNEIIPKKEAVSNKGKFGVGAFFTPTWTSTYLKGEMNEGKIETGNTFLYSGNWGFEFRYFISNRFTLVTGIGKSEIRSWSKSIIGFDYDLSTEHTMPNGEKENTSPVPMQTPFGEINTEITYRFPGDQSIPDGEPMYSALETNQELRYLSIPLGVEFNIIRFSRFNWFADAGIRYNRALKDATQFTSRILHEGHDMDVVAEQMTSHPAYTENYLNFFVGIGLSYQFSKSFQINVSARYFGNITDVNLQENMSTYVHGFNLKFGIVYIF